MAQLTNRYTGSRTAYAHVAQVLEQFEDFAEAELRDWRPSGASAGQQRFTAHLKRSFNIGVDLKPAGIGTWLEDAFKRDRHRKRNGWFDPYIRIKPVRYEYSIRFDFVANSSRETAVSFETIEEVDPDHNIPRRLGDEFKVPAMPENKGRIGEKFLGSLR
jgi:hypothetical protein